MLNKGTTGTIFITSLVWRGPWLGIEPGTSRTWSQHSITRLLRFKTLLKFVSLFRFVYLHVWPIFQELRKSGSLKQQLEVYKRQVLELQSKSTEETKRADKSEFEVKRSQEKLSTLQREKEVECNVLEFCFTCHFSAMFFGINLWFRYGPILKQWNLANEINTLGTHWTAFGKKLVGGKVDKQ